jgi:hypothetical protein
VTTRKDKFNNLFHPDDPSVPDEEKIKLKAARERLRRIVEEGEVGKNFDHQSNRNTRSGALMTALLYSAV